MGQTNQAHDRDGGSEWITEHSLAAALIVYAVLSIPVYIWLEGPVGIAGTVDASLVVAGLVLGSILFVPIIKSVLVNTFGASRVHTGVK
ncbi:hypothetical protein M0R89_21345 (plasmid) [Halorussus limi]|uniref:Uncharacterized protein n=1 Tax=Halorussus limi TaxID=2938695 RepID=A0A8U0I017_9EURY|nr:hypothetical protein [Halorussus limi]UPV76742.1 hypothetical protein M0R89_21345 [Halorussus limi]